MSDGIPRCHGDSSPAFLAEGYLFGTRRFEKWQTDAFACRLAGRCTVVLRGQDAARFFSGEPRLTRMGAIPRSVVHSLQDEGSVQTLSAHAHRARKGLFLDAFGHEGRIGLAERFEQQWSRAEEDWRTRESIALLDEVCAVLTRTALGWAGISVESAEIADRTREFQAMIDGAGSFGRRNWRGRMLRRRTERWAASVVEQHRATSAGTGTGSDPPTPIDLIAQWQDAPGQRLDTGVAAVELLNALRPIVAIGRFILFAALALGRHPDWRSRVLTEPASRTAFGAEVAACHPLLSRDRRPAHRAAHLERPRVRTRAARDARSVRDEPPSG